MSIVGWRPIVVSSYEAYTDEVKEKISKIIPGLSGVGSIVFRDEEKYYQELPNPHEFYDNVIRSLNFLLSDAVSDFIEAHDANYADIYLSVTPKENTNYANSISREVQTRYDINFGLRIYPT